MDWELLFEKRKKMVYEFICDEVYVPMKAKELAIVLNVKKEERMELDLILQELVIEGKITLSKRGKYAKAEEKLMIGTFNAHPKGFGFVSIEGETEDIFIPETKTSGAFHMDKVQVSISPVVTGRRKEGSIVNILERGMKELVCTYEESKTFGFAVPDNPKFGQDIFIPLERS